MNTRSWLLSPILGLTVFAAQANAAALPPDTAEAVARLRTYRFGRDRAPLDAVGQLAQAALADPVLRASLARDLAAILATDASYDAKQFACRELALIATDQEVPALAAALNGSDAQVAQIALYALARVPGPVAAGALRAALNRTTGLVQVAVIHALGERRDPQAVAPLRALVDASGETALAAAASLGKIGGNDAAKTLENAFAKTQGSLRETVADALLVCASRLADEGDPGAARRCFQRLYRDASSSRLQAAGLRGLVQAQGAKALPQLLESLRDDGSARQRMAAELLRGLPGLEVAGRAAAWLPELAPAGQVLLLGALADRADRAALASVEPLCSSPDAGVRLAALRALGQLGDASVVRFLASRAAAGPTEERDAARASLAALSAGRSGAATQPREGDVDGALVRTLADPDSAVQVEVIRALGQRQATPAVPALLRTAANADRAVRVASWRVLRDLARASDLPALVDLLLKSGASDRDEAETTVVTVARSAAGQRESTTLLLSRLAQAPGAADRGSLLRVLGQLGHAEALAALRQALADPEPEVKLTVARALAEWSTDEPLNDLLATAQTASDPQLRAVALRGYIRLVGLNENRRPAEALALYREALALGAGAAEKRLVLSGLAALRSVPALELAAAQLAQSDLKQEAEITVLQIARAISGACPQPTRAALDLVLAGTPEDTVRKQAQEILAMIGKFGDFVMAWEYSPAYTQGDVPAQGLFDLPFPPELADQAAAVNWRLLPTGLNPDQPWLLDLLAALGGESRVAYLRSRVHSDRARSLVLELGSDDGIKVWLNGQLVHGHNVLRAIEPGQEKVTVNLKEGPNDLLLKVTQNNMGWGACARFREPGGGPAAGLQVNGTR